jgi:glyoxylase I family protein
MRRTSALVKELEVTPGDAGSPQILLLHQHSSFLLGLWTDAGRTGDSFGQLRTGLDHIALEVADRADIDSWIAHVDKLGVGHSPVRELAHSSFVSLEDPGGFISSCG